MLRRLKKKSSFAVPFAVPFLPKRRAYRSQINRRQSGLRLRFAPVVSVIAASALPLVLPFLPSFPLLPPFGLMLLIAWKLLRTRIWPLWVGFPLGLLDDLMSGQPLGSAAFLWSVILLLLDMFEQRMLFRDYLRDWLLAAGGLLIALIGGAWIAGLVVPHSPLHIIIPQIIVSILIFPIIVRFVAALDRWRLAS